MWHLRNTRHRHCKTLWSLQSLCRQIWSPLSLVKQLCGSSQLPSLLQTDHHCLLRHSHAQHNKCLRSLQLIPQRWQNLGRSHRSLHTSSSHRVQDLDIHRMFLQSTCCSIPWPPDLVPHHALKTGYDNLWVLTVESKQNCGFKDR